MLNKKLCIRLSKVAVLAMVVSSFSGATYAADGNLCKDGRSLGNVGNLVLHNESTTFDVGASTLSDIVLTTLTNVDGKVLTAGDTKTVFYAGYAAKDISGNPTTNYILMEKGLILGKDNMLTTSSQDVKAQLVQDPKDSSKGLIKVTASINPITVDMPVVITAITLTGKSSQIIVTLKKQSQVSELLASSNHTQTRLSGSDRYETSSKIALNGWTQSDYAVLALGEDYPDALCAAPLAGKYKAPILLTETNSIPTATLATIKQLHVKNIFIVGGTGAISKGVQDKLTALGVTTTRLAGATRYDTSIAIAKQLGKVSQIAIVTGEDYADALSMAPIAVKLTMPIIIVEKNNIPKSVKDYVASQIITKTYVVGKGTSINNVSGLPNVTEINGIDKYVRNTAIISAFKSSLDFSTIYIATGESFTDALSGSVLAGINGNVLLLVGNDITNGKKLLQLDAPNANIKILGGVGAIADSTVISMANTTTSSAITIPTTIPTTTPTTVDDSAVTKGTKVSKIAITSTVLGIGPNGQGYASYSIYDESGKDITNSSLSETVTFKSQVGTIAVKRGLLTLTPNADISFSKLSSVVITGKDSITGVSISATLMVPIVL